jgi:BASS family bile acid:Na+ symporter
MKNINIYKILLGCSLLLFIVATGLILFGKMDVTGPLVIGMLMCVAIGVRGFKSVKSFSYTIWIFTAVAA